MQKKRQTDYRFWLELIILVVALAVALRLVRQTQEIRKEARNIGDTACDSGDCPYPSPDENTPTPAQITPAPGPCKACYGRKCLDAGYDPCSESLNECNSDSDCLEQLTPLPTVTPIPMPTATPAPNLPPVYLPTILQDIYFSIQNGQCVGGSEGQFASLAACQNAIYGVLKPTPTPLGVVPASGRLNPIYYPPQSSLDYALSTNYALTAGFPMTVSQTIGQMYYNPEQAQSILINYYLQPNQPDLVPYVTNIYTRTQAIRAQTPAYLTELEPEIRGQLCYQSQIDTVYSNSCVASGMAMSYCLVTGEQMPQKTVIDFWHNEYNYDPNLGVLFSGVVNYPIVFPDQPRIEASSVFTTSLLTNYPVSSDPGYQGIFYNGVLDDHGGMVPLDTFTVTYNINPTTTLEIPVTVVVDSYSQALLDRHQTDYQDNFEDLVAAIARGEIPEKAVVAGGNLFFLMGDTFQLVTKGSADAKAQYIYLIWKESQNPGGRSSPPWPPGGQPYIRPPYISVGN